MSNYGDLLKRLQLSIILLLLSSHVFAACPVLKGEFNRCSTGDKILDSNLAISKTIVISEDTYNSYARYSFTYKDKTVDEFVEGHNVPSLYQFYEGSSLVSVNFHAYTSCHGHYLDITNSDVNVSITDDSIDDYFLELLSRMTREIFQTNSKLISIDESDQLIITRYEDLQEINITCKRKKPKKAKDS